MKIQSGRALEGLRPSTLLRAGSVCGQTGLLRVWPRWVLKPPGLGTRGLPHGCAASWGASFSFPISSAPLLLKPVCMLLPRTTSEAGSIFAISPFYVSKWKGFGESGHRTGDIWMCSSTARCWTLPPISGKTSWPNSARFFLLIVRFCVALAPRAARGGNCQTVSRALWRRDLTI